MFKHDVEWQQAVSLNRQYVWYFKIEQMMSSADPFIRLVAEQMAAVLLIKIPELSVEKVFPQSDQANKDAV